MRDPKYLN